MDTVITNDDRIAMAEVDYIIHHMNEIYFNKIPQKVKDYITILKSRSVNVYVDPRLPLEQQGLKEFTLYFLMILNLKYWCDNERKKDILARMDYNQKKIDEKVYNIFDQAENLKTVSSDNEADSQENKPRQIVTVGGNNDKEIESKNQQLENEADRVNSENANDIAEKPKENLFTKIINKVKSLILKNK